MREDESSLRQRVGSSTNGRAGSRHAGETSRLRLLGGFELEVGGEVVTLPLRVQRLVAFLGLRGRPLHRAYVSGHLWADTSQAHAFGSLRSTLWAATHSHDPLIEATSTHVGLSPRVRVDAEALARCAERVVRSNAPIARTDFLRLLHSDELLPDWYDDWALWEQTRLRELRLLALERAATGLLAAEKTAEASLAALAAVGVEPLRDSANCVLIDCYLQAGNTAEASRHARAFCDSLRQLGIAPSPRIQALLAATLSMGTWPFG